MEASKICERQPLKNITWSIIEYFVPNVIHEIPLNSGHQNSGFWSKRILF